MHTSDGKHPGDRRGPEGVKGMTDWLKLAESGIAVFTIGVMVVIILTLLKRQPVVDQETMARIVQENTRAMTELSQMLVNLANEQRKLSERQVAAMGTLSQNSVESSVMIRELLDRVRGEGRNRR